MTQPLCLRCGKTGIHECQGRRARTPATMTDLRASAKRTDRERWAGLVASQTRQNRSCGPTTAQDAV